MADGVFFQEWHWKSGKTYREVMGIRKKRSAQRFQERKLAKTGGESVAIRLSELTPREEIVMFRQLMTVFALAVLLLAAPVALADESLSPQEIVSDWFSQWLTWIGVDSGKAPAPQVATEKTSDGGAPPPPPASEDPQDPNAEIGMTIDPNG